MATFTKQFSFNVDAESWVATGGGATGIFQNRLATAGAESPNDPNAGSGGIRTNRSGKSLSDGTPYWEWSGTWEALGVPTGATITAVNLDYDWTCNVYTTGAASTTGPAELRDSSGTLRGTFSTSLGYSSTTAYATRTGTAVTGLTDASTTSIKLRIGGKPNTGSSSSALVEMVQDWVVVTVTYTPAAGSLVIPRRTQRRHLLNR